MANKRVSNHNNPLIDVHFKITKNQKDFLDNFKESTSAYIRKLIDTQMSGHEAEIAELKEELRQHDAQANILKAQIGELEAEDQRKQAACQTRQQLIDQAADRIMKGFSVLNFKNPDLKNILKTNLMMVNRDLNNNGDPVIEEELKTITIKKAEARGIKTS